MNLKSLSSDYILYSIFYEKVRAKEHNCIIENKKSSVLSFFSLFKKKIKNSSYILVSVKYFRLVYVLLINI